MLGASGTLVSSNVDIMIRKAVNYSNQVAVGPLNTLKWLKGNNRAWSTTERHESNDVLGSGSHFQSQMIR